MNFDNPSEIAQLIANLIGHISLWGIVVTSIVLNIVFLIAWLNREKYLEFKSIRNSGALPVLNFEINTDEKYRAMVDEIASLKAENKLLKKKVNRPYVLLGIFLFLIWITSIFKHKSKQNSSKDRPKLLTDGNDNSKQELILKAKEIKEKIRNKSI